MSVPIVRFAMRLKTLLVIVAVTAWALRADAEWVQHPKGIQTIYQEGVPHTDRNGKRLTAYDAKRSFFPRGLYHALHGTSNGREYQFKDYVAAGFNCCFLWDHDFGQYADAANVAGMQLIAHQPSLDQVKAFRSHPAILAWRLDEEPTGGAWDEKMKSRFKAFEQKRDEIHAIDPDHPVFVLDVPWIMPPATETWVKWNTGGDITCHDNYPINQHHQSLSFENGICETVSLAVSSVKQKKPMWLCAQAFESPGVRFPFAMPSSRELRCMAYTAIVHGATGILQFALDSGITRNGGVVGMAPDPQPSYGGDLVATKDQLRMSRDLWQAAVALNKELVELEPTLLSPTATIDYNVSLDKDWQPVSPEPIRTLVKRHPDGGYVLIVVNVDAAPQHVRIGLPKDVSVEPMFETSGVALSTQTDGAFEFQATPYDVRILRLKPGESKK